MKKTFFFIFVVILIFLFIMFNKNSNQESDANQLSNQNNISQTMTNELKKEDLVVGSGQEAKSGDTVSVQYRGVLTDGTQFDSSYERNQPFVFVLGKGSVIQGWDEGVPGMQVGGKRKLTIPPHLAYGTGGIPGVIPPDATLIFEVELLEIK